ncbi:MAG: transposase [Pseudomonadota bacterium]
MATKRRKCYGAQFKFQVALDAAKGMKTINELAAEHSLRPNQISQWKRQLLEEGPSVFSSCAAREQRQQEASQAELFEQIGRLKMELEWLKKTCSIQLRSNA